MRKNILLLLFLSIVLLSSCTSNEPSEKQPDNNVNDLQENETEGNNEGINDLDRTEISDNELVWVVSDAILPDANVDQAIYTEFNHLLKEKGFDFTVRFIGYDAFDGESYLQSIIERKETGEQTDLIFTGFGNEDFETNIEAVNHDLLEPFEDYLQTENGKKLYNQFNELNWERVKIDDIIYGLDNNLHLHIPNYIFINENISSDLDLEVPKEVNNLGDLEAMLEQVSKLTDEIVPFIFWGDARELTEFDYLKTGIAADYNEDGVPYVLNPFENESVIENIEWLAEFAELNYWRTDEEAVEQSLEGNFYSMVHGIQTFSYIDGSLSDVAAEGPVQAVGFHQSDTYVIPSFSGMYGIASWSDHKEAAFEVLTLVNTDPDLSNLLYYGMEGEHYNLNDEYVTPTNHEKRVPGYFSPANEMITYPAILEPKNKEEFAQEWMDKAIASPFLGFSLDETKIAEELVTIQSIYEKYENLWIGEDVESGLKAVNQELKDAGIEEVLEEVNRQLQEWWMEKE